MMPARFSNKGKLAAKWNSLFIQGVDLDRWNRYNDAVMQYERCASAIENDLLEYKGLFNIDQLNNLKRLCSCVRIRTRTLKNVNGNDALTLTEMQLLIPFMRGFLTWKAPFPIFLHLQQECHDDRSSAGSSRSYADDEEILSTPDTKGKPLLPMMPAQPGKRRLTIRVISIGARHPEKFIQPFITVAVKGMGVVKYVLLETNKYGLFIGANSSHVRASHLADDVGISIAPDQDVRWPVKVEKPLIIYERDVEIQRYLENIYRGCAIYFEMKYHKKKEKLVTTKCFAFLEAKAIRSGSFTLALFKAPVKYNKRHLVPLSTKAMYLSIHAKIHDE